MSSSITPKIWPHLQKEFIQDCKTYKQYFLATSFLYVSLYERSSKILKTVEWVILGLSEKFRIGSGLDLGYLEEKIAFLF